MAADKHALLIGIEDYSQTPFKSLKGPINDIAITKQVLTQRFHFEDKDFIILLNKQATHTGIENGFKKLIQRVKPNDFVYIYYSGHGSQTIDLNGDELSGKDQTWVSYGARSNNKLHKDNYDVLDDEIRAWLVKLYAKTHKVVFVSDSCHSATVTKSNIVSKTIRFDQRSHILGYTKYPLLPNDIGIRIGAAREYESAIELPMETNKYYGIFTWYWVKNLQQAQANDTWNNIFKRTAAQITNKPHIEQCPQIAGKSHQQILSDDFTSLPATAVVHRAYDNWVGIKAGFLTGVTKGSVYKLYNKDSSPSARLTISQVTPFASFGIPEPKGSFKVGDLVITDHSLKIDRVHKLKTLKNPYGNKLPITVQTYLLTDNCKSNCVRLSDYGYPLYGLYTKQKPRLLQNIKHIQYNSLMNFILHNKSNQDYYSYLIYISPKHGIYTIFPDPCARTESARIKKGETRDLIQEVIINMDEIGKNSIFVITSVKPIDTALLEQEPVKGGIYKYQDWAVMRVDFDVR
jgi:hypothetical protein